MRSVRNWVIAVSILFAVSVFAPSAVFAQSGDAWDWPVQVKFSEPTQVGSMVLAPGTYDFRLTSGTWARNVIAVYSVDRRQFLGMVMGINDSRQDTSKRTGFTFENIGDNSPRALQFWFYQGWNRGIKFVYPEAKGAVKMAEARK